MINSRKVCENTAIVYFAVLIECYPAVQSSTNTDVINLTSLYSVWIFWAKITVKMGVCRLEWTNRPIIIWISVWYICICGILLHDRRRVRVRVKSLPLHHTCYSSIHQTWSTLAELWPSAEPTVAAKLENDGETSLRRLLNVQKHARYAHGTSTVSQHCGQYKGLVLSGDAH